MKPIAIQPNSQPPNPGFQPRFSAGLPLLGTSAASRLGTQYLQIKEGASGTGVTAFAQATATVWAPKAAVSRSWADFSEITFLEVTESLLFYFGAAAISQFALAKRWFLGKNPEGDAHIKSRWRMLRLGKPQDGQHTLEETVSKLLPNGETRDAVKTQKITTEAFRRLRAQKAATILAALGIIGIGGEYALSFGKNLLTEKAFHKTKFSDVVGLSDGEVAKGTESPQAQKAKHRIKETFMAALGILGASMVVARTGHKVGILQKPLDFLVRKMDFSYSPDAKTVKYGLSKNQLRFIITSGVISYMDAARDFLEQVEVATRLALVVPYLWTTGDLFNNLAVKRYGHRYKEALKPLETAGEKGNQTQAREVRSLKNVLHLAKEQAVKQLKDRGLEAPTTSQINRELVKQPIFRGKMALSFGPLFFGMATVGAGVALLNRVFTRIRYERSLAQQQQKQVPQQHSGSQSHGQISRVSFPFKSPTPLSSIGAYPSRRPLDQLGVTPQPHIQVTLNQWVTPRVKPYGNRVFNQQYALQNGYGYQGYSDSFSAPNLYMPVPYTPFYVPQPPSPQA
ncbi:MAG: hypothetical protein KTR14_06390 [Vampirovibrio sp.]|nr:hypothetical protein [Vampirovibrio sp.]